MTSVPSDGSARLLAAAVLCLALALAGCSTHPARPVPPSGVGSGQSLLEHAQAEATWADQSHRASDSAAGWARCAAGAHGALAATSQAIGRQASALATHCTDQLLARALRQHGRRWSEGPTQIDGTTLTVEFRKLSPTLRGPLTMVRAQDVPMHLYGGERFSRPGLGVPLALITPRCEDAPACQLLPPEGVFRWATAWIEPGLEEGAPPRLVIGDPVAIG